MYVILPLPPDYSSLSLSFIIIIITMQLRSGKTIQPVSGNANNDMYNNPPLCGHSQHKHITMRMRPSSKGKYKDITSISTHPMSLRSSQSDMVPARPKNTQIVCHTFPQPLTNTSPIVQAITSTVSLKDWLVCRLKGFIMEFSTVTSTDFKEQVLKRCRVLVEMTDVMYDHIDYITSSTGFARFSHVLCEKLREFTTQITLLLNGPTLLSGRNYKCNFTPEERTFMGNARADFVRLLVIAENRLYGEAVN